MPWKVRLRRRERWFDLGLFFSVQLSRPEWVTVSIRGGSPRNQRQVSLVYPWPNCQGWIVWKIGLNLELRQPGGFSMQTRGIGASHSARTNSTAVSCSARLDGTCPVAGAGAGEVGAGREREHYVPGFAVDSIEVVPDVAEDVWAWRFAGVEVAAHGGVAATSERVADHS